MMTCTRSDLLRVADEARARRESLLASALYAELTAWTFAVRSLSRALAPKGVR